MKMRSLVSILSCIISITFSCMFTEKNLIDYPIREIHFTNVTIHDNFWKPRFKQHHEVTIPHYFHECEKQGRVENFPLAAGFKQGEFTGTHYFDDSDVYKVIEGAALEMLKKPDPEMDQYVDSLIHMIEAAQGKNGFLNTRAMIGRRNKGENIDSIPPCRWDHYVVGHLYESAVAHYQATGKTKYLNVALKNADLMVEHYMNNIPPRTVSGHQEIKIGLVKLYEVTGERKYLDLAKYLLDARGRNIQERTQIFNRKGSSRTGSEYLQDHKPVTEQDEAVGHAVRAVYMYLAMADIAVATGDLQYIDALKQLWKNVVSKKMYVTGGIGSTKKGEAFGANYELPNLTAYCETCAAMALAMWGHRMFKITGDGQYLDVLERSLYNNCLSGISLDGDKNFYENDLISTGCDNRQCYRKGWWGTCCPYGIGRFIPQVPEFFYATQGDTLYINLYGENTAVMEFKGQKINIIQETKYPWDGKIKIKVIPDKPQKFTIKVRVPGWVRNQPVPSDLYAYLDPIDINYSISINGERINPQLDKSYAVLSYRWKKGDEIDIHLPMNIQRVLAHEKVKADSHRVAVERGPIIYCAEGVDHEGNVLDLVLPDHCELTAVYQDDLLNGIVMIKGEVLHKKTNRKIDLKAIPYYAWAHRERSEMIVWFQRN